jgi:outer membrane protein assembly factor BamE (lipoprotein component of BamABCDE complex)
MKNILIISLLAFASQVAQASETVEINRVKYTKYSEDEIRSMIVKMNSLQPDMSAKQVISIMGQPIREQLVSNSPPQRILVYPLSIVVSLLSAAVVN